MMMQNIASNDNCNFFIIINDEWFRLLIRLLYLPRIFACHYFSIICPIMILRPVMMQMPKVIAMSSDTDRN